MLERAGVKRTRISGTPAPPGVCCHATTFENSPAVPVTASGDPVLARLSTREMPLTAALFASEIAKIWLASSGFDPSRVDTTQPAPYSLITTWGCSAPSAAPVASPSIGVMPSYAEP